MLLEWGAAVDVTDNSGRTPLAIASERKYPQMIKILEEHTRS
jgi:hypothetical protein